MVEIQNESWGIFQECSGGDITTEPIEYREGGYKNNTVRKMPGLTKYGNIVLKWGITADRQLYDWYHTVTQGEVERKDGSIVLFDSRFSEAARWNFVGAWPTKYDAPDFNSTGTEVAVETLELAIEGLERVQPEG